MHDIPTTAELINRLFAIHLNPATGKPYTPTEVAVASEGRISQSHLHRLRGGQIKSPTRDTLLVLCEVFRVHAAYFFPELADQVDLTPE